MMNIESHHNTNIQSMLQSGKSAYQAKQYEQAYQFFQHITNHAPLNPEAWFYKALIKHDLNELEQAINFYSKALELAPNHIAILTNLSKCFFSDNNYEKGINTITQAISLDPKNITLLLIKSQALFNIGDYKNCIDNSSIVLTIEPNQIQALYLKANSLHKLEQFDLSIEYHEKILQFNPNHIDAINNLSALYGQLGNRQQSLLLAEKSLSLVPSNLLGSINLSSLYLSNGQYKDSLSILSILHQKKPNNLIINFNLAQTYLAIKEHSMARQLFEEILTKNQWETEGLHFKQDILKLKSLVSYCICLLYLFDWDSLEKNTMTLTHEINQCSINLLHQFISPHEALRLGLEKSIQQKVNQSFNRQLEKPYTQTELQQTNGKTHIAYLSPDFGQHSVGLLISDLFKYHDKSKYTTTVLSLFDRKDNINQMIRQSVDNYHDISQLSDQEAYRFIRELNIDILVDLAGPTKFSRCSLLSLKPAPIMAHWLGYPTTTSIPTMDYYITHQEHVGCEHSKEFSEKLIFLPHTWIAVNQEPFSSFSKERLPSRKSLSLPENGFIFSCFHTPDRIDKQTFNAWITILKQVPDTYLWLFSAGSEANQRLLNYAQTHEIETNRIIFKDYELMTDSWFHCHSDLWLDVFNVSSGTGAVICSIHGPPMLTLEGKTPESRWSSMHQKTLSSPELVAISVDEYIRKASYYAQNKTQVQQLAHNTHNNDKLFNQKQFCHDLEQLYDMMIKDKINSNLK